MSFTAKSTDLETLKKATVSNGEAKGKADAALIVLTDKKKTYDDELVRRKAQNELYKKATEDAAADKITLDAAVKRAA
jgi:hypothetical protein